MEIDNLDENSQPEETLGDDEGEEEDEVNNKEVIVIHSPLPTVVKK
jgi:hypothetical protein